MNNKVVIAAAGSGKTTHLIKTALKLQDANILITTFTDENADEIKKKFYEEKHCIPPNITLLPWFSFLLKEGVRPYQGVIYEKRISNLLLVNGRSALMASESDFKRHYLADDTTIYSDKISKLACKINELSEGKSICRLEKIYTHIFIDECQDLAGYDLDFLEILFASKINILLVGDPRQATFVTNNAQKNSGYRYSNIDDFFKKKRKEKKVDYDDYSLIVNHRCVQSICNFSNKLYPKYTTVQADFQMSDEHKGVWIVRSRDVHKYIAKYHPMILRHDKGQKVPENTSVLTFGKAKGRTYNRVLIFPTKNMIKWIKSNKGLYGIERAKFYVAITRARLSVAIVHDPRGSYKNKVPVFEFGTLLFDNVDDSELLFDNE